MSGAAQAAVAALARLSAAWRLTWQLWRCHSLPEWRLHTGRLGVAVLAGALGVALALSVHLINQSAMGEFSAAMRSAQGQADLTVRASRGDLPEALFTQVARSAGVAVASPVLQRTASLVGPDGRRVAVTLWGVDALAAGWVTPQRVPQLSDVADGRESGDGAARGDPPGAGQQSSPQDGPQDEPPSGLQLLDGRAVFLNAAARQVLGPHVRAVQLLPDEAATAGQAEPAHQAHPAAAALQVRGQVDLGPAPSAVMDIAAVQDLTGSWGRLSRIELRLQPGVDAATWARQQAWPPGVLTERPEDSGQRVSELSRAYRVNLTVLALVALFTGGFLVYSVQALSVARRLPQWALLGVLGLSAAERRRLVWLESALLGGAGAVLGVGLGTALADLALRLLGGDLGGGYFQGVQPSLQWSTGAALAYGGLGLIAAWAGGWAPAAAVADMPPAQALKGLGLVHTEAESARAGRLAAARGVGLLVLAAALAQLPSWGGVPWAAYASVMALLLGGLALVPAAVSAALALCPPRWLWRDARWLLAIERARRMRHGAAVLMAGIVASLSLSVAITVMVASFRTSVIQWLDVMLPADLYLRVQPADPAAADSTTLPPTWPQRVAALPGVARARGAWIGPVALQADRPPITLIARPVDAAQPGLPLVGALQPIPAGAVGVYVSEAVVDLYGAQPGHTLSLPLRAGQPPLAVFVAGVWRDYARQSGAIVLPLAAYQQATGDTRLTDLGVWFTPDGAHADRQARLARDTEQALRAWPDAPAQGLQAARPAEIRVQTLQVFDRSFAVTLWLQAVAIGIGLFGTAASFSAQVLARRKEFGLLAHLGVTRRQVLGIVAGEGAVLSGVGAAVGLGLGLLISLVLVKVVNPQSFHWTMDMSLPWPRLLLLCGAVLVAGTGTAWLAGRSAVSVSAVRAVREEA